MYEKTTLIVIHYRLIIFTLGVTWDVQGLSKSSDNQMPVFLDNSGNSIDVGHYQKCLQRTAPPPRVVRILLTLVRLQRLYATTESPSVFFPNSIYNNAFLLLGVFFMNTQNLITQHCSADASIFTEYLVTHCLEIHKCSVSYTRFFFFLQIDCCSHLLLHSRAFYRLRKSFLPTSTHTIVCRRGMSTCFQVTSYTSLLVPRTVVGMCWLESL